MLASFYELLEYGKEALKAAGVAEYETDAWLLLSFSTGIDRTRYLCDRRAAVLPEKARYYRELVKKRAERIPLQQITGEQAFMGLDFEVNEHVLIPRQDTEVLVEEAGKLLKGRKAAKVLDLCTGSGCIIVSLAHYYGKQGSGFISVAEGADISEEALAVAKKNAKRHKAEVSFIKSDLFSDITGSYDMIVSNPPYIRTNEIAGLEPEVREHEPLLALDGGKDGLYFYRAMIDRAGDYLTTGGWLLFEIGWDQAAEVCRMFQENGYQEVRTVKDLAGLDRVCIGKKMEEK